MATTFTELREKVLDWSNRDREIFGSSTEAANARLHDFIRYAADKCYRQLRVPALEFSRSFVVEEEDIVSNPANAGIVTINMPVPQDLIEVIHIRNVSRGIVVDEHLDMRTFFQRYANKTTPYFWTRQQNTIKIAGLISIGDEFELHYYRRLAALDATYLPVAATYNIDNTVFTYVGQGPITPTMLADGTFTAIDGVLWFPEGTQTPVPNFNPTATATDVATHATDVGYQFVGTEADNWLRDENERILIFGALAELFAYLGEEDMLQKYAAMYQQEIDELNREENMRIALGGNVKINYNSCLI